MTNITDEQIENFAKVMKEISKPRKFITKKVTLEEDTWKHIKKCAESENTSIDTIIELAVYAMNP